MRRYKKSRLTNVWIDIAIHQRKASKLSRTTRWPTSSECSTVRGPGDRPADRDPPVSPGPASPRPARAL